MSLLLGSRADGLEPCDSTLYPGRWGESRSTSPLLGLEDGDGVAVGVLEPGRSSDARGGDDVVDGLERREVVLLELDAVRDEVGHVLLDVARPEPHLGVV